LDYFIFIIGLLFGSFFNVVIFRLPLNQNIAFPSSHCTSCNGVLKWYHNIPIISWLFLKGKCSYCSEKISFQYPLVELLTGFLFYFIFIFNNNIIDLNLFLFISIFSLFLCMSFIDFKYKLVPNSLNFLAFFLALFFNLDILNNLHNSLLFAGGLTMLMLFISSLKGVDSLGEADIIIFATIGALLGIELGMIALFFSSFIALPFSIYLKSKFDEPELPFVPFLALSTFIVFSLDRNIPEFSSIFFS
jgi:leader peptidase (prepilin peptidase)/N-methyltransferase